MHAYAVRLCTDKYLFIGNKTFEEFKKDFYKSLEEIVEPLNISKTIEYNGTKILVTKKVSNCPDVNEKIQTVKQIVDHINKLLNENKTEGVELITKLTNIISYRTKGDREELLKKFLKTIIISPEFHIDDCEDLEGVNVIFFYTQEIDMYDIIELNMKLIEYLRSNGFKVTYPAFDSLFSICDIDIYPEQFEYFVQKMKEKGWELINEEGSVQVYENDIYVLENGKWIVKNKGGDL